MISQRETAEVRYTELVDQYLDHIRAEVKHRTWQMHAAVLRRAHADLPHGVVVATDTELRGWLWASEWSAKTRHSYAGVIRGLHRYLARRGYSDYNPTDLLPKIRTPRRLPRPITDDELQHILAAARDDVRLWSTIAAYAGARCVEIFRLDRRDITAEHIRLNGKGDRERLVPTHPMVWDAVHELPRGRIVVGPRDPKRLSERCEKEYNRIGLDEVTLHRLRHWFATTTLAACGDVRVVQELLGHANIANTAIYTAVLVGRTRDAVAALPTWGSGSPAAADQEW